MSSGDENVTKSESDEEDYESFFLQPASSPYNIKDKLEEANKALFEDDSTLSLREQRVQFHENLVDYEPDLTDDDVQSIESYNESPEQTPVEELQYILSNSQIYDIQEEEDEIKEEIVNEEIDDDVTEIAAAEEEDLEEVEEERVEEKLNVVNGIRGRKKSPRRFANYHIDCKNHCIEQLDSPADRLMHVEDERPRCPPLKLQMRKCCERTEFTKLPIYTGCRSEYGLSARQLERRERHIETIKLKEQKRSEIQREFAERRREQNEEIFRQWLKDIADRRGKVESSRRKLPASRPQTAHCPNSRAKVKRKVRPHSSNPCVFIKVPEDALRKGLKVGVVVVARKVLSSKQLEIYALQ